MIEIGKNHIKNNNTIGFIPTMGALHKGHLSLIQKARKENDVVIVSIFINPKQFDNKQDLKKYPHDIKRDKALIGAGADYLLTPTNNEMYPSGFQTSIGVGDHTHDLEGKYRPGHFEGMATVVCKLLSICKPTRAYLGLKDYQQYIIVSQMVKDLHINTKIVGCPTIRETSGLALSSRNMRLSAQDKDYAAHIYQTLFAASVRINNGEMHPQRVEEYVTNNLKKIPTTKVEYVATRSLSLKKMKKINQDIIILVALSVGSVRLIDNIIVPFQKNRRSLIHLDNIV